MVIAQGAREASALHWLRGISSELPHTCCPGITAHLLSAETLSKTKLLVGKTVSLKCDCHMSASEHLRFQLLFL